MSQISWVSGQTIMTLLAGVASINSSSSEKRGLTVIFERSNRMAILYQYYECYDLKISVNGK
jgi:hypothetical protein